MKDMKKSWKKKKKKQTKKQILERVWSNERKYYTKKLRSKLPYCIKFLLIVC